MYKAVHILKDLYFDSVVLMGAAAKAKSLEGVIESAFFMGTPANKLLLTSVGLALPEVQSAGPGDLILAVEARNESLAESVLHESAAALTGKKKAVAESDGQAKRPRALSGALREAEQSGGANLAFISLPGRYVASEAMRALKRGLNTFIFSDNVPLEAEVRLKIEAEQRGLLCMGPDCGTAWINGVGLGFCNEVPRGRVGLISASGTGLQAVACLLAAGGEGISHGIGVGGRDLSRQVLGRMTLLALKKLEQDPLTEAIVIISKPPAPETLALLDKALGQVTKPVVLACLGQSEAGGHPDAGQETGPERTKNLRRANTLADAAGHTLAMLHKRPYIPVPFSDPKAVAALLAGLEKRVFGHKPLLGLFTGGTLAHEAHLLLHPLLGAVAYGDEEAVVERRHCILDLGDDQYTQGRPHPMIDPLPRAELLARQGHRVGVVLIDLVLGRCSHPDPAAPLARSILDLQRKLGGEAPVVVGSVVGTDNDSQNRLRQEATLREAGAILLPDNAQAARFAALLLAPETRGTLLFA